MLSQNIIAVPYLITCRNIKSKFNDLPVHERHPELDAVCHGNGIIPLQIDVMHVCDVMANLLVKGEIGIREAAVFKVPEIPVVAAE